MLASDNMFSATCKKLTGLYNLSTLLGRCRCARQSTEKTSCLLEIESIRGPSVVLERVRAAVAKRIPLI